MKSAIKTSTAKEKNMTSAQSKMTEVVKQDALALLKADHRKVEGLFEQFEAAKADTVKSKLTKQICLELAIHTAIEEEIFYPACRDQNVEHDDLDEAQVEHDGAKVLIRELLNQSPSAEYFDAKVKVLSEYIKHHVGEEEKPKTGIFSKAKKAGVDMAAVGSQLATRKAELMAEAKSEEADPPKFIALQYETGDIPAASSVKAHNGSHSTAAVPRRG